MQLKYEMLLSNIGNILAFILRCYCRCCCGNSYTHHCGTGADVQSYTAGEIKEKDREWSPGKNTRHLPTDAYGTIEFQGGPHPTKAQVHIIFLTHYSSSHYHVVIIIIMRITLYIMYSM